MPLQPWKGTAHCPAASAPRGCSRSDQNEHVISGGNVRSATPAPTRPQYPQIPIFRVQL